MREGDGGDAARELRRRLAAAGFDPGEIGAGLGPATTVAVRAFQASRGLPPTGWCDEATWAALLEARYELGDRLLYHRRPMQRGDDVAELQRRLNHLGFDAGRVDGIFGPLAARAVEEFQRHSGCTPDGICGPLTVAALDRLGRFASTTGIDGVREVEALRQGPRRFEGTRWCIGTDAGSRPLARAVGQVLRAAGAHPVIVDDPSPSRRAAVANTVAAVVHLDLSVDGGGAAAGGGRDEGRQCLTASYYATQATTSVGGRRLAHLCARVLVDLCPATTTGSRAPVLRETRMPAVQLALPAALLERPVSHEVVRRLTAALHRWVEHPMVDGDQPTP